HNYNMPPYSTGETGRVGSPKRREIGHGALAERALLPVLPTREEFPYAIRQVSEAIGSNGSTSMGSVCASTMSLLDAGVPLKDMVSGIAMGLINEGDQYVTLTDILGAEDAMGDMDFKVAGTKDIITALQLDTKLDGIPSEVLAAALKQAKDARLTILEVIAEAIDGPDEMSPYSPRVTSVKISVVKTAAFGAFVSLLPGKDGLVHISKLGNGKRIAKVEDVVNVGDKLRVEIADIDNRGKISLIVVKDDEAPAEGAAPAADAEKAD